MASLQYRHLHPYAQIMRKAEINRFGFIRTIKHSQKDPTPSKKHTRDRRKVKEEGGSNRPGRLLLQQSK